MKKIKILLISLSLVGALSSCNLPDNSTQTIDRNLVGTIVAMTMQTQPARTQIAGVTPTIAKPTVIASLIPTRIPPDVPILSAYNYTCELADGGSTMTMNIAWTDRSSSEEGYKIYRDEQVIATLAANSTFYVDVAFVASGKTLSYSVEAFNANWQLSTSTITVDCQ